MESAPERAVYLLNVQDTKIYDKRGRMSLEVARCIPVMADKVGKGINHFHFEATLPELWALVRYAHYRYDIQQAETTTTAVQLEIRADTGLEQLARNTLFVGRMYHEKVPQLYHTAWRYQLNQNKISREEVEKLIPNKDIVNAIFNLGKYHLDRLSSHRLNNVQFANLSQPDFKYEQVVGYVVPNIHNFEDCIFLQCSELHKVARLPKEYTQFISGLKNMSQWVYNCILYQDATHKDVQNLSLYIQYHYAYKQEQDKIIFLKRELDEALTFEALVRLTSMAWPLYEKFPEHLVEFWNFWSRDELKSMSEETFIKNYFSGQGNREIAQYVYQRFIKKETDVPGAIIKMVHPKIDSSSPTFFQSCIVYKKSIIGLLTFFALAAGQQLEVFNISNLLSNLKSYI